MGGRFDERGRLVELERVDAGGTTIVQATYTYDVAGRVVLIQRSNGVRTSSSYDVGGRVTAIEHSVGGITTIRRFEYSYFDDDTIRTLRENDAGGLSGSTTGACSTRRCCGWIIRTRLTIWWRASPSRTPGALWPR